VWAIDFLSKNWALANLASSSRKIIGDFLKFTLVRNPGAAFSMATGFTVIFTSISVAVGIFITRYASKITHAGWSAVAGLVLGGVLGNLTDRIFRSPGFLYGHVIDWIELPHWPVFNIADSAIVIAAVIAFVLTTRNIPPYAKSNGGLS
jgi:signal peptidase II